MAPPYVAACGCAAIQLQLCAEPLTTFNCHCSLCRKMSGAAFATHVVFPKSALQVADPDGKLGSTPVGEHGRKHFCTLCGTPLYGLHALHQGICLVSLGALDEAAQFAPQANVFCADRLPWVFDLAAIPAHDRGFDR